MQEKNTRINEIYVQMQPGKELLPLKRTFVYGSNLPTYESEAGSRMVLVLLIAVR